MSIFETLAQKPWLPSQEKKDNLHTGKSFEFDSSRVALICFLGSITALFSLFFVAYVGRMAYGDWRILPEPPLLWINTAVLIICLLYTSPSPRDATLSRMPSSA